MGKLGNYSSRGGDGDSVEVLVDCLAIVLDH